MYFNVLYNVQKTASKNSKYFSRYPHFCTRPFSSIKNISCFHFHVVLVKWYQGAHPQTKVTGSILIAGKNKVYALCEGTPLYKVYPYALWTHRGYERSLSVVAPKKKNKKISPLNPWGDFALF